MDRTHKIVIGTALVVLATLGAAYFWPMSTASGEIIIKSASTPRR